MSISWIHILHLTYKSCNTTKCSGISYVNGALRERKRLYSNSSFLYRRSKKRYYHVDSYIVVSYNACVSIKGTNSIKNLLCYMHRQISLWSEKISNHIMVRLIQNWIILYLKRIFSRIQQLTSRRRKLIEFSIVKYSSILLHF